MTNTDDIRAAMKEGTTLFGADRALKLIRQGKLKKVFLAANVRKDVGEDIHHYGKLSNVEVIDLNLTNEEIGTVCKKPFLISVIGVRLE